MPKFHFISGLPRSGSTLLSAILSQNPRFTAGMTSPVGSMCTAMMQNMSGKSEFATFFSDEIRNRVLRNIFLSYYGEEAVDAVVFDTNRRWTTRMPLINSLFPSARVICCVRDIGWILDSLERAIKKNPAQISTLMPENGGKNVYSRVDAFMKPDNGLVGSAWSGLREAWFGEEAQKLIIIPYDRLTSDPLDVMKKLYKLIDEPYFDHDFNDVTYSREDYDQKIGTPGLHHVAKVVERKKRKPIVPSDIFKKYADNGFWLHPGANINNVVIL